MFTREDSTITFQPHKQQQQSKEEAATFLSTCLDVHGRHSERWLTGLVDCSLAHPNTVFAVACGEFLLAIYDEADPPEAGAPGAAQFYYGGSCLDLDTVVPLVCQFATAESLRAKSVFFTDSDTVEDIREWVSAGGDFRGDWGPRFQNQLLSKVHGRPMHSHAAERPGASTARILNGGRDRQVPLLQETGF